MSFLAGLGAFSGGAASGINNGADLVSKYQRIKEGQMALDTAKKQLMADAAVFSGLDAGGAGGAGGGGFSLPGAMSPPPPSAQPMPPGQPSMPAQPPQGGPAVPGQPPGGMAAPQPQQAPQGAPQQPQQPGGGQGSIDPTDPRAAVQTVMSIAKEIKSRNPGIDPQTLMLATDRVISMSKGIAPAIRQGAQVVIQQMRDATSSSNTDKRVGATDRATIARTGDTQARIDSNETIAAGHDATSIKRVQQQGEQAMARTQAVIAGANQRAAQGVWSREKATAYKEKAGGAIAKLKAANSRLTSLTNMGVKPDDPRVTAATKDITGATAELDRINSAAKVEPAPGGDGGGLPSDLPDPKGHAEGSSAKDASGKVVAVIKNGQWAPPAGP